LKKNDLKTALDERLSHMDWHGEDRVWRRVKRPAARFVRLRTAVIACLLIAALGATALAARTLLTSAKVDIAAQARAALKTTYGLTGETLSLFSEHLEERENGWTARYNMPLYGDWAGEYVVVCEKGRVTASWSHDGEEFPADGSLQGPVWGQPQLERLRQILHDRQAADPDDATLADRAAMDAPLLGLPYYHDAVNILPGEDDLTPGEAEALARTLLANEFQLGPDALDGYDADVAFRQTPDDVRYYAFTFTNEAGDWHRVWFTSPEGDVLRIESRALLAAQPAEPLFDPEDILPYDYEDWTVEERYAYAEAKRQAGRDPTIWRDALPEEGELTEEAARQIAEEAIFAQYGVTGEALSEMWLQTFCQMNYWLYEDAPFKEWFFWFQDGLNNYQVRLRASDGTVEGLDYFDDSLGSG